MEQYTTLANGFGPIEGGIAEAVNQWVSRAESIREFRILPEDFTVEGGELTTALGVTR